ncbi:hypothetical protein ACPCHT_03195 [Nucisporomicrobium flavum]|uniref:restriction endonuclease-related protein n=1 Tax=Nucisporomicrobium flavum TaxID=2785915 RepID=UPI003C2BDD05
MDTQDLAMSSLDDDYLTVTLLAAGLTEIVNRRAQAGSGEPTTGSLLPPAWRVGFARLWLRWAELGELPAWSDLELMALCRWPMASWPVTLTLADADLQHSLLDGDRLTAFAEQGARFVGPDVEASWTEHRVYDALRRAASANGGSPAETYEAYACLRRFLIDHAVVDDRQVMALGRRFGARDNTGQTYVQKLIQAAYNTQPSTERQRFQLCSRCGNVVTGRRAPCGTAGCVKGGPTRFVDLDPLAVVYELNRATRRYIHDPGLVEARLLDSLSGDDLSGRIRVTPYPLLDRLDVLVEFLDGGGREPQVTETWGIEAKDQVSAPLLGRLFVWPDDIECDRRILALPMHRARRGTYVADLRAALDGRVNDVDVVDEDRLIGEVRKRARELSR